MFVSVCAWCRRTQGVEWTHEGSTLVSHGICLGCKSAAMAESDTPPRGVAEGMASDALKGPLAWDPFEEW